LDFLYFFFNKYYQQNKSKYPVLPGKEEAVRKAATNFISQKTATKKYKIL